VTSSRRSAVVSALVAMLVYVAPVLAGNSIGFRTSADSVVTYAHNYLTTITHNSAHDTNDNNVYPTDITPNLFHNIGGKEVSIYDGDYGDTIWAGRFQCTNWGSANLCYQGNVEINHHWGAYRASSGTSGGGRRMTKGS